MVCRGNIGGVGLSRRPSTLNSKGNRASNDDHDGIGISQEVCGRHALWSDCSDRHRAGPRGQTAGRHHHDRVRHGIFGIQYRRRAGQGLEGQARRRYARSAGRQRRGAPRSAQGEPGAGVRHGHRRLFRAGSRVRVRDQGMGTAAAAPDAVLDRLQRHLAGGRRRYGRQGDQGPQGQARRPRGRFAGAQSERLRRHGFRWPDQGRRQAGRVRQQQRHVEGHAQQRGRRGDRLDDLGAGQGNGEFATWRDLSADARRRHGGMGADAEGRAAFPAAQGDLWIGHPQGWVGRTADLRLSDFRRLCRPACRCRPWHHQGDDRQLRRLQGRDAGRGWPRGRQPEPQVGHSLPRRRGQGAEGSRGLEGRARDLQQQPGQAAGRAHGGLGRLPQDQSARRQGWFHERLGWRRARKRWRSRASTRSSSKQIHGRHRARWSRRAHRPCDADVKQQQQTIST